jgi:aromatic ring-opening dioxygenase catalytic subunit (LigB family)
VHEVVTAHWITNPVSVSSGALHPLLFDYGGFPRESYTYRYDAPGSPELSQNIIKILADADLPCKADDVRGWDHGVFVPLMLMFPDASIPVVALSLHPSLDPSLHIRLGEALAPLREQGVLIIGSGASFHNFDYFFARDLKTRAQGIEHSRVWDRYLEDSLTSTALSSVERRGRLVEWARGPSAYACHKPGTEEHLIPLHVILGAAKEDKGRKVGEKSPEDEIIVSNFEFIDSTFS